MNEKSSMDEKSSNNNDTLSIPEVCSSLRTEVENMRRALTCSICMSTYTKPVTLTSCVHAYCRGCITKSILSKKQCPLCQVPCNRRSLTSAPDLQVAVRCYKKAARAFGLAPATFTENILLTQLESDEQTIGEEDMVAVHDELLAARTFSKNTNTSDYDRREQSNIVAVNEQYLLQASVRQQHPSLSQIHREAQDQHAVDVFHTAEELDDEENEEKYEELPPARRPSQSILEALDEPSPPSSPFVASDCSPVRPRVHDIVQAFEKNQDFIQSSPVDDASRPALLNNLEASKPKALESQNIDTIDTNVAQKLSGAEQTNVAAQQEEREATKVHSITESIDSVQREGDSASPSERVEREENSEKDKQPLAEAATQTMLAPHREEVADRTSSEPIDEAPVENRLASSTVQEVPVFEHVQQEGIVSDGPVPSIADAKAVEHSNIHGSLEREKDLEGDDSKPAFVEPSLKFAIDRNEVTKPGDLCEGNGIATVDCPQNEHASAAASGNIPNHVSLGLSNVNSEGPATGQHSAASMLHVATSNLGDSAENPSTPAHSPFPIGTIVQVQSRTWPGINQPGGVATVVAFHQQENGEIRYDVQYVLDKRKEKSVEATFVTLEETIDSASKGNDSGSRNRRNNKGSSELPPALLAQLAAQGFDVVGVATGRALSGQGNKENSNRRKRKSKEKQSSDQKRQKSPKDDVADDQAKIELPRWTAAAKCKRADEYYQRSLSSALSKGVVYACSSGLSEEEEKSLKDLARAMKSTNVRLLISDAIQQPKTTMCIVPSVSSPRTVNINSFASRRTMKTMQASLFGIPLVSSQWIGHCLEQRKLVLPESSMYIRTLPCKRDDSLAHYGVAMLSALRAKEHNLPFPPSLSFYLCGFSQKNAASFRGLLQDAGVKDIIVTKQSVIARAKGLQDPYTLVIICDDASYSFTDALVDTVRIQQDRMTVVNSQWLVDSVSCGFALDACDYAPKGGKAKALWQLTKELSFVR